MLTATPVDPRDVNSEIPHPTYRVIFWRSHESAYYHSEEYDVTGAASVREVITWCDSQVGARDQFELFVLHTDSQTALRLDGYPPKAIAPVPYPELPAGEHEHGSNSVTFGHRVD